MTSKHWTLVGGAVACLISFSVSAAPWIEPGDARARHALQKLSDRGHLDRAVTTWPMSWADVHGGVNQSSVASDSGIGQALAYLRFEQGRQAEPGFRGEFSVSGTNEPAMVRGSADQPGEEGQVSVDLQWQGTQWAFGLSPSYVHQPEDDKEVRFDNSYLAGIAGNWVIGAGTIDRWWGPGWQHSLILSNNARPVPAVWISRNETVAPETPWLQWLGPWQVKVFGGQFESNRVVPDAKLLGMRFAFKPVSGLDVGLSRIIMFGGEGRPEGASTLWNALIGRDNGQLEENDPGNQLGSIDARYGFAVGNQAMGIYGQMMGEDEAGAFPARKSWLLGVDWTTALMGADQQWYLEYANTLADDFLGDPMPNITYQHSRYQTGYHHYGRSMGASIGTDAEAITLGLFSFLGDGSNIGGAITVGELNKDGTGGAVFTDTDVFAYASPDSQSFTQVEASYGTEVLTGWLDLKARYADQKLQLIGGEKDDFSLFVSWRYRF